MCIMGSSENVIHGRNIEDARILHQFFAKSIVTPYYGCSVYRHHHDIVLAESQLGIFQVVQLIKDYHGANNQVDGNDKLDHNKNFAC